MFSKILSVFGPHEISFCEHKALFVAAYSGNTPDLVSYANFSVVLLLNAAII
jgi:hypothetical protein